MAINSSGNIVAIGTYKENGANDKVYIFERFDNVWLEVTGVACTLEVKLLLVTMGRWCLLHRGKIFIRTLSFAP